MIELHYPALRRIAQAKLGDSPSQTLQATGLVHEVFVRLLGKPTFWNDAQHFIGVAAISMSRILVERNRRRSAKKRKHRLDEIEVDQIQDFRTPVENDSSSFNEVLELYKQCDARKAELVSLRLSGMSELEICSRLGISRATASRWWLSARTWLYSRMSDPE